MAKESFHKMKIIYQTIGKRILLALFLLVFILFACKSSEHMQSIALPYADPQAKRLEFIDSLKANKIDTLIGFYAGCVDCQPNSNGPYYVFWKSKDTTWFLTKFARTSRYNILKGHTPPINYIHTNLDILQSEILVRPKEIRSGYHYERVTIILQDVEFDYTVKHYERQTNSNTHRIILLDSIRSTLSNIPDSTWKAVDY